MEVTLRNPLKFNFTRKTLTVIIPLLKETIPLEHSTKMMNLNNTRTSSISTSGMLGQQLEVDRTAVETF